MPNRVTADGIKVFAAFGAPDDLPVTKQKTQCRAGNPMRDPDDTVFYDGAGNGNRTRRSGLGSRGFTTRLYLRTASCFVRNDIILTYFFRLVNTKRGISFTDFHGGSGRGSEKRENRIHPE